MKTKEIKKKKVKVVDWINKLYFGDNLTYLKEFSKEYPKGFIDLIYIDPPFNSKRNYNVLFESIDMTDTKAQKEAFADTWSNVTYYDSLNEIADLNHNLHTFLTSLDTIGISKSHIAYLTTMAIRIIYMHKLLKSTGSFYLHCDPTMSHYLKLVCDLIFGEKYFRNEIVWCYTGASSPGQRQFPRKHDVVFWYSKSDIWIFNDDEVKIPYSESTLKRAATTPTSTFHGIRTERTLKEGGKLVEDYWFLPVVGSTAKERLGYPTQKPKALLERIISASSNKGDIVADFFCGCGTAVAVAEALKRKWIGIDISHLAVNLIEKKRLIDPYRKSKVKPIYEIHGFPKDLDSAKELANNVKGGKLLFEQWIVEVMLNGVLNDNRNQLGYDGYLTYKLTNNEKEFAFIEVKGGHTDIKHINHFINTVDDKKAGLGIFVCFNEFITPAMRISAKKQGHHKFFKYDKIQIIPVEDLLNGIMPNIPESNITTFKKGESIIEETVGTQTELFSEDETE